MVDAVEDFTEANHKQHRDAHLGTVAGKRAHFQLPWDRLIPCILHMLLRLYVTIYLFLLYHFHVYSILVQVYVIRIAVMLKYTVFYVMTEKTAKKLYQFLSKHHVTYRRVTPSQELEATETKMPFKEAVTEHSYNGMLRLRSCRAPFFQFRFHIH